MSLKTLALINHCLTLSWVEKSFWPILFFFFFRIRNISNSGLPQVSLQWPAGKEASIVSLSKNQSELCWRLSTVGSDPLALVCSLYV